MPSMVCARCTGIYMGAFASSILFFFVSIKKELSIKYLFLFSVPLIVDIILYSIGIYHYSKVMALITGLLLGSAGFFYLYNGLNNFIIANKKRI